MPKCFGSNDKQVIPAQVTQYDPFGVKTGGREERNYVFNQLDKARPQMEANRQATVDALKAGASNPGYAQAQALAQRTMSGDFLHGSPELENQIGQMRAASSREGADTEANLRDQFARNGMSFSTANQQAAQSNKALTTARANDTEAGMRMQNYAGERSAQMQAPQMLDAAVSAPINYLAQTSSAETAPMAQIAQIVAGLAGNGQVMATPQDVTDYLGYGDMFTQGMGRM